MRRAVTLVTLAYAHAALSDSAPTSRTASTSALLPRVGFQQEVRLARTGTVETGTYNLIMTADHGEGGQGAEQRWCDAG